MNTITQENYSPWYPWLVWLLGASFFFAMYFARLAPNVMASDLMAAFNIQATKLGLLSACFDWAYIAMQIPVGMLADRFSPRRLMASMCFICAGSCFLLATSHSLWVANVSRVLMGFSASFAFVGTLKLANIWFPPIRFGLLAGLTQALGMLGAAIGQGPMSLTVSNIGWRNTMLVVGFALFVIAGLIAFLAKDRAVAERVAGIKPEQSLWQGLMVVLRNPQTWWNGLFVGLLYAPTAAFAELWGVSYLMHTHHVSNHVAATAVGFIFIGWTFGGPLFGWISDRFRKRKLIMGISAWACLLAFTPALYIALPMWLLFALLFLYGFFNMGVAIGYVVASENNPRPVAGTSMAFANMASIIIGAAFQPIIGWLLDLQWDHTISNGVPIYSEHAYIMAVLALPICLVLALLALLPVKETGGKALS